METFDKNPKKYQLQELDGKAVIKGGKELKFSARNVNINKLLKPLRFSAAPPCAQPEEIKELLANVIDTKLLDAVQTYPQYGVGYSEDGEAKSRFSPHGS